MLLSTSYAEYCSLSYWGSIGHMSWWRSKLWLKTVSRSCLVLAGACRLEGRDSPSRAFCGSWLQGSWRDSLALVMPLIPDKVNFVWLECTVSEFEVVALSQCMRFILALHECMQSCLNNANCPVFLCDRVVPPWSEQGIDCNCSGGSSPGKILFYQLAI